MEIYIKMVWYYLFIFSTFHEVNAKCTAVISEINGEKPKNVYSGTFIELEFYCSSPKEVARTSGYKIIIINGKEKQPDVELYANLEEFTGAERRFFTIGEDGTANTNMNFSHSKIFYRSKNTPTCQTTLFISGTSHVLVPFGAILLYAIDRDASRLDNKLRHVSSKAVKIDDELKDLIQKNIKDMIVYGSKGALNKCAFFENLYAPLKNEKFYMLRDINTGETSDSSLGLCSDQIVPYQFNKFKVGKPTPGNENDCSGSQYFLEEKFAQTFEDNPNQVHSNEGNVQEIVINDYEVDNIEQSVCYASGSQTHLIEAADDDTIERITNEEYDKGSICDSPANIGEDLMDMNANVGHVETLFVDDDTVNEPARKKMRKIVTSETDFETTKYFKSEWIEFIRENLGDKFHVKWFDSNPQWKTWLTITPNYDDPSKTKFHCRICKENFDNLGFRQQMKSTFASDNGFVLGNVKHKNREAFEIHIDGRSDKDRGRTDDTIPRCSIHQTIIDNLIKSKNQRLKNQVEELDAEINNPQSHNPKFAATANMFRLVYTEALLNIPLHNHIKMVELLKVSNVAMGTHHYERRSATRMLMLISETFHSKFLRHVLESNYPLSLILDATTDAAGKHFVIVYLRSLEADKAEGKITQVRPVLYFYKLLEFGLEETSQAYLDLLKSSFEETAEREINFEQVFKSRLIAFGSDGASVMIGKNNGLIVKLKEYLGRPILSVHCLAHRLHLATGRAWKDNEQFKKFEKIINNVYVFYNNRGHKRKAHLRATASILEVQHYEFNQVFPVRWIASELEAVSRVNKSYSLLLHDLEQIKSDADFNAKTQQEAEILYNSLKNKNFLVFMRFIIDILRLFTKLSTKLQSQYGVIIDKTELFETFRHSLSERKTRVAVEELMLYESALCQETLFEMKDTCGNNEKFEISEIVTFENHLLGNTDHFVPISTLREEFIDALLNEVDKYFAISEFKDYKAFEPKNLPTNVLSVPTHTSVTSIGKLLRQFNLPLSATEEWVSVLSAIVDSDSFVRLRKTNPQAFYSHFLADEKIPWQPDVRKFIESLLVVPIGSADAERGFSILKHIRYDRRSRLGKFCIKKEFKLNRWKRMKSFR